MQGLKKNKKKQRFYFRPHGLKSKGQNTDCVLKPPDHHRLLLDPQGQRAFLFLVSRTWGPISTRKDQEYWSDHNRSLRSQMPPSAEMLTSPLDTVQGFLNSEGFSIFYERTSVLSWFTNVCWNRA